jgi:hypothetical protein
MEGANPLCVSISAIHVGLQNQASWEGLAWGSCSCVIDQARAEWARRAVFTEATRS